MYSSHGRTLGITSSFYLYYICENIHSSPPRIPRFYALRVEWSKYSKRTRRQQAHPSNAQWEAAEIEKVHGGDGVGALLLRLVLDVRVAAVLSGTRGLMRQADALYRAEHAEHAANTSTEQGGSIL